MKKDIQSGRRKFFTSAATIASVSTIVSPFNILIAKRMHTNKIIGHGDYQYRVDEAWGNLNSNTTPVKNCDDVCIDEDKNIYVCQWNANKSYPIKLERV